MLQGRNMPNFPDRHRLSPVPGGGIARFTQAATDMENNLLTPLNFYC
jgi:hypothetical protein